MPNSPQSDSPDADSVYPGDVVWLDSIHLTPTRGSGNRTWPHFAVCLFHYYNDRIPDLIVSRTIFQFVCISSITRANPFDSERQVLLDHTDPNLGLTKPSAACVDFAPGLADADFHASVTTIRGEGFVGKVTIKTLTPTLYSSSLRAEGRSTGRAKMSVGCHHRGSRSELG